MRIVFKLGVLVAAIVLLNTAVLQGGDAAVRAELEASQ
jgi:hypothetical protein